tara:strand:- start:1404 stop:1805 length:402 start_codon:yes stop_codon:yes gene_type:complete
MTANTQGRAISPRQSSRLLKEIVAKIGEAVDSNMPLHQALVLFIVATANEDGIEMRDIARQSGLSTSSVSRNIAALGEWHRLQRPGLGLVETRTDLADRRRKPVHLTKKGEATMQSLNGLLSASVGRTMKEAT